MIGHLDTLFGSDGPYPDAASRLDLLAEAFDGWPVRAAAALRDPADWIASSYAFAVAMRPQPDFDSLRPELTRAPARLGGALRTAAGIFPGLAIWTVEAARERPRLPLRMLVGDAARDVRPVRNARNISLSGPAVTRLQELRARGEPVDEDVRAALAARWPVERHGAFDPWTAEERRALAGAMAEEVGRLRAAGVRVVDGARGR